MACHSITRLDYLEVKNNLRVQGTSELDGETRIGDNLRVRGDAKVGGNLRVRNDLDVKNTARIGDKLFVKNDLDVGDNMVVEGNSQVNGSSTVGADLTVEGSILPHRYVRVAKTTNQAIVDGTGTGADATIIWQTIVANNGLNFVTGGTQFTVPQTGIYSFKSHLRFAGNAIGARGVGLAVNSVRQHYTNNVPFGADISSASDAATWFLQKDDTVEVLALQNSGGVLNVVPDDINVPTYWEITQLR